MNHSKRQREHTKLQLIISKINIHLPRKRLKMKLSLISSFSKHRTGLGGQFLSYLQSNDGKPEHPMPIAVVLNKVDLRETNPALVQERLHNIFVMNNRNVCKFMTKLDTLMWDPLYIASNVGFLFFYWVVRFLGVFY